MKAQQLGNPLGAHLATVAASVVSLPPRRPFPFQPESSLHASHVRHTAHPVHPPPIAYPSNAFQNRARTEFNNKRAAHFEIDLSRPFSRRVSLSLFPPLDLAGERMGWDGFIPFLPF